MRILALDLGTTTGWAAGTEAGIESSGNRVSKSGRYEGGGMRYLHFRRWLDEMRVASGGGISVIYFEEVRNHAGTDAAHVYGGFLAVLTEWCEEQQPKTAYCGVPVGTIKKHVTGKGNASKEMMIRWAETEVGRKVADDNEADAVCLYAYALTLQPAPRRRRQFGGQDANTATEPGSNSGAAPARRRPLG